MARTRPRDVLSAQVTAAELGVPLRIHRERVAFRPMLWIDLIAVLVAVGILLVSGFADWRAALTFVVAVWWLAYAGWCWAPLRRPRRYYVVAQHGLLISDLREYRAAPWSRVRYRRGVVEFTPSPPTEADSSATDAPETAAAESGAARPKQYRFDVPVVSGSDALDRLLRQENRLPQPPPPSRWFWRSVVWAATALVVWFAVVPLGVDVVLGRVPTTVADLNSLCKYPGLGGFGRGAAYQGAGPHPIVLLAQEPNFGPTVDYSAPTGSLSTGSPAGGIQLVACLTDLGDSGQNALESCPYTNGSTITVYPGDYQITVYDVRTGRQLASIHIPYLRESEYCSSEIVTQAGQSQDTTQDAGPDPSAYPSALAGLVNGPARD